MTAPGALLAGVSQTASPGSMLQSTPLRARSSLSPAVRLALLGADLQRAHPGLSSVKPEQKAQEPSAVRQPHAEPRSGMAGREEEENSMDARWVDAVDQTMRWLSGLEQVQLTDEAGLSG